MSLRRHGELAPRIREAIGRVVKSLEIGEDGYDLAAVQFITAAVSREESLDFERRFIDDLVEAVGRVLVDEDAEPVEVNTTEWRVAWEVDGETSSRRAKSEADAERVLDEIRGISSTKPAWIECRRALPWRPA